MGIYFRNYLGAFLVIQNKETLVEEESRICSECNYNYANGMFWESKFCHKCGAPIIIGSVDIVEIMTGREEICENDDLVNSLYFPEYPYEDTETYGFANNSNSKAIIDVGDDDDDSIIELNSININDFKEAFREEYKEILEALDKAEFEYEIKFGLCRIGS